MFAAQIFLSFFYSYAQKFIRSKNRFELKFNIEEALENPIVIIHLDIQESF